MHVFFSGWFLLTPDTSVLETYIGFRTDTLVLEQMQCLQNGWLEHRCLNLRTDTSFFEQICIFQTAELPDAQKYVSGCQMVSFCSRCQMVKRIDAKTRFTFWHLANHTFYNVAA